jgi:hypothetical protein
MVSWMAGVRDGEFANAFVAHFGWSARRSRSDNLGWGSTLLSITPSSSPRAAAASRPAGDDPLRSEKPITRDHSAAFTLGGHVCANCRQRSDVTVAKRTLRSAPFFVTVLTSAVGVPPSDRSAAGSLSP